MALIEGFISGDSGDFRGRGGVGALSEIGRGSTGVFKAHPSIPIPSAPFPHLFLRLKVSIQGVIGVPIELIRNPKLKKKALQVIILKTAGQLPITYLHPTDRLAGKINPAGKNL